MYRAHDNQIYEENKTYKKMAIRDGTHIAILIGWLCSCQSFVIINNSSSVAKVQTTLKGFLWSKKTMPCLYKWFDI
jgi:hypothetical protein